MKIYLHEITDLETELDFTQSEKWVVDAVERVDEHGQAGESENLRESLRPSSPAKMPPPRDIRAHFSLRKVDDVVVVSGEVDTYIELVCSRCANPFRFETHPRFSSLFCQDPDMAGVAHLEARPGAGRGSVGKPVGQNKGFARHAHDFSQDEWVSNGKDLDITYLSGNYIDLSDILSEQLQLQVPFQPLCREGCKGICPQCGTDLNTGRCACAKLNRTSPFAGLQNFKV